MLKAIGPDYRKILRQDDEVEPTIIEFASDADQQTKLLDTLVDLRTEGLARVATLGSARRTACHVTVCRPARA